MITHRIFFAMSFDGDPGADPGTEALTIQLPGSQALKDGCVFVQRGANW
jgi:hypothetical protein